MPTPTLRRYLKGDGAVTSSSSDEAEIRDGAGWSRIGIAEALRKPKGTVMRCPSCGGRVRAHREGTTAQRAHFEHYQRHDGCPTKRGHKGPATRHPHTLD